MAEKLFGEYKLLQSDKFFKLTTDSVFLSSLLKIAPNETAIELGTGAGALWVLAAAKNPNCRIDGVEILPDACELARKNQALNHMEARGKIICMDVRKVHQPLAAEILAPAQPNEATAAGYDLRQTLAAESYDVCFSNPPYFNRNCGARAQIATRESARGGASCKSPISTSLCDASSCLKSSSKTSPSSESADDFCKAASFLLKKNGRFYFCYRPNCAPQIEFILKSHGFSLQKTTHIHSKKPVFDMFFAQKNAEISPNRVENINLFASDGQPSAEYRRAYMLDL